MSRRRTRVPRTVPAGQLRRTITAIRRFRMNFVFGTLLVLFAVLLGRLVQLQVLDGERYAEMAERRQQRTVRFRAQRGRVLDRFGWPLAVSKPYRRVAVDTSPEVLKNVHEFSVQASAVLGGRPAPWEIRRRIHEARHPLPKADGTPARPRRHITLRRRVEDPLTIQRLDLVAGFGIRMKQRYSLYGLLVEREETRVWPNGPYAVHAVGKPPVEGVAPRGVEGVYDAWLSGRSASVAVARDGRRRLLAAGPGAAPPQTRGRDLHLTLDLFIQHRVEAELDRIMRDHARPEGPALGLVMDARTGEVLAWANRPHYDPNVRLAPSAKLQGRTDFISQGLFEFGSVFKPFTVAWALQHGVVQSDTHVPMPQRIRFGRGKPIHDSHYIGDGSLVLLLAESSNTGAAWLGHHLGTTRMRGLWERLGFGRPVPCAFRYARAGRVNASGLRGSDDWHVWLAERSAFGQGVEMTPLHLVSAYAAFARADGRMLRPTLVRRDEPVDPRGAVLADRTAMDVVRAGLRACVTTGTLADPLADCAWAVAGKTGTSQSRVGGREDNIASVVAYAPADDPQVIVLVSARVPKDDGSGASVAGPAVRRILDSTLAYWGVPTSQGELPAAPARPGGTVIPPSRRPEAIPAPTGRPSPRLDLAEDVREVWNRMPTAEGQR